MKFLRILLPFLLLIGAGLNAAAGSVIAPLDASEQVFFKRFRTAVQSANTRQLISLTHPLAKQCIREEDRAYRYERLLEGLANILGRQQMILDVGVAPLDEEIFAAYCKMIAQQNMGWPIKPEKQIIVKYTSGGMENVATIYIAHDQEQWKWVHICSE